MRLRNSAPLQKDESLGALTCFPGCFGVDGKRVQRAVQFRREGRINHAVALDPALSFERLRYNINAEMRLAARPVAGMAFMKL